MPRNGSGIYNLPAGNPVVPGTIIRSTWANTTMNDIATALSNSLAKDGQTVPTGNLPMGGFKFTNVGPAVNPNEYLTAGQDQDGTIHVVTGVANPSVNVYTGNLAFGRTTFVYGQMIVIAFPPPPNLGPSTLNLNSGGAQPILDAAGNPLIGGELITNAIFVLCWDGTAWRIINSPGATTSYLPLAGGSMTGRINLPLNTPYDLVSGAVNTALYATGSVSPPAGKQPRVLFWDGVYTFTGTNNLVSGYNFQPTVHTADATDNSYGVFGAVSIDGPGACKGIYGRGVATAGSPLAIVGCVGAVTIMPGATPSNAWCLQLEHKGHATALCIAGSTDVGELCDNGFVVQNTTNLGPGAAFQYNKYSGGGSTAAFLRMLGPTGTILFEVDKNAVTKLRSVGPVQFEQGSVSGTFNADFNSAQSYNLSLSGNITLNMQNVPAGAIMRFMLQATTGKTLTITGVAALQWPNGVPPTIDAGPNKMIVLTFWNYSTANLWAATYTTY